MAENKIGVKERWEAMSKNKRIGIGVALVVILTVWLVLAMNAEKTRTRIEAEKRAIRERQAAERVVTPNQMPNPNSLTTLVPESPRNQGLEDMQTRVEANNSEVQKVLNQNKDIEEQLRRLNEKLNQASFGNPSSNSNVTNGGKTSLNDPIPGVDFNQPIGANAGKNIGNPSSDITVQPMPSEKSASITFIEPVITKTIKKSEVPPPISIPKNAVIESVMLSGINAMVNVSSGTSATGPITAAKQIGTPFIARVKGNAMLPNGWKVAELDNCFISGSGIGVLATEKANVIADSISCVDKKGVIFEAKISAYGVDLDGIQGISGHLVTKQGSLLLKTALAGIASGLGQALTPQPITNINTGGITGATPYTLPSSQLIAGTSLGTGISNSMSQLSGFYLSYARQIFPVVEVIAGTRITWVLQQGVELEATKAYASNTMNEQTSDISKN